jgi:hypothetical protein
MPTSAASGRASVLVSNQTYEHGRRGEIPTRNARLLKYTSPTCGMCAKGGHDGKPRPVVLRIPVCVPKHTNGFWTLRKLLPGLHRTRHAWREGLAAIRHLDDSGVCTRRWLMDVIQPDATR